MNVATAPGDDDDDDAGTLRHFGQLTINVLSKSSLTGTRRTQCRTFGNDSEVFIDTRFKRYGFLQL